MGSQNPTKIPLPSTPNQRPKDDKYLGIFEDSKRQFSDFDRLYCDIIQQWHNKNSLSFPESDFLKSRINAFRTASSLLTKETDSETRETLESILGILPSETVSGCEVLAGRG